jgi:hypothetical protein
MTVQEQMRDLLKRHCTNLLDQVDMWASCCRNLATLALNR